MDYMKILDALKEKIYTSVAPLHAVFGLTSEPVPFEKRKDLIFHDLNIGDKWGNLWDCAWMRFTGMLPEQYSPDQAALRIDISGEGCIFEETGKPLRGITNMASDYDRTHGLPGKRVVRFSELGIIGHQVDIWMDCACNDLFGKDCGGRLLQAEIVVWDDDLRDLYYDTWVLHDAWISLKEGNVRDHLVLPAYERMEELFGLLEAEDYAGARRISREMITCGGCGNDVQTAVGHAHLDLAWLWPLRETRRKAIRTFSTMMRLMERYPDYTAGISQPQQFVWVKEDAPLLYQEIRQRVSEGRLEAQGALWVEADLNTTGGEALIRQCIYGRRFFDEEFGVKPDVAHLPDVFGFNAALPQILLGCGIDKLVTIKLSWNRFNRFPHSTFHWEGIDGSQVLVHIPPEGTYNSSGAPHSVLRTKEMNCEDGKVKNALLLFGIGDGGGGPGPEHLERIERMKNLAGFPQVIYGTEKSFFQRLEEEKLDLAVYQGELYLEKHQGTYTTRLYNKRHNRISERLLADAEYFACSAYVRNRAPYPRKALDELWKEVLLYQFHDILPGSSINRVYDECEARYPVIENKLRELIAYFTPERGEKGYALSNASAFSCSEDCIRGAEDGRIKIILKNCLLWIDSTGAVSLQKDTRAYADMSTGNIWAVYRDGGDAWDYEDGYKSRRMGEFECKSVKVGENSVTLRFEYGNSSIVQIVTPGPEGVTLRMDTEIDFREKHCLIANEFTDFAQVKEITCGIQFGSIKRTLLRENAIDKAKTEFCAQRFVDISDADSGFAILNDGIFGYSADGGLLRMHVLRNASFPSEYADTGVHRFAFELYPHASSFENSDVPYLAERVNSFEWPALPKPLFDLEGKVVVSTIKLSDDGKSVVLRFYEPSGIPASVSVRPTFACQGVRLAMLDETPLPDGVDLNDIQLKPFEIRTLLFDLE